MAWTTPKTWTPGMVNAADMNLHVRDNLNALKAPATGIRAVNAGADYTTSSTSFAFVDLTDLGMGLTLTGGDVLVSLSASVDNDTGGARVYFDVRYFPGPVDAAGDDGLIMVQMPPTPASRPFVVHFNLLLQGLGTGLHQFYLRWKTNTGVAKLYSGAGTSGYDVHPFFVAREIS